MKLLPFFIALMAASCKNDGGTLSLMPESVGRCGEVLVVMDDKQWQSPIGDTIQAWLRQEVLVLPQYEPTFKVMRVHHAGYSKLFRKTRNVIFTDIRPENKKSEISIETNKFSAPQLYITIKAPSDSAFLESWYKVENIILDTLTKTELSRLLVGFKRTENYFVSDSIKRRHNIKMTVPGAGFNLDMDSTNFAWISKETNTSSQGILLFDYKYQGPKDFNLQYIINKFDSILMRNVQGPEPGSFMQIEKKIEPMKIEKARNGNYMCELRGLWETEGAFMGGPFVSQSMVDTVNNRLVTVFSFVYGGKKDKKMMLWQLESIMTTFNINYEKENHQQ